MEVQFSVFPNKSIGSKTRQQMPLKELGDLNKVTKPSNHPPTPVSIFRICMPAHGTNIVELSDKERNSSTTLGNTMAKIQKTSN